jgi:UDP-N-acetylglucosamine 2-epimerase
MKVMTIVGTRPELIKLSRVIKALDQHTQHILVHTGQNFDYELNEVFFSDLDIRKPDYYLEAAGKNAIETIANVMMRADELFEKVKPDALLIYGDTNSCMVVIPAKKRRIPIFHMEAGNRCFDARVPEEINRKIVDHLSDINMPLTEHARRYLIEEGLPSEQIIKTGSCLKEVLAFKAKDIAASNVLKNLNLTEKQFFLVSAHREENLDNPINFANLMASLEALAQKFKLRILVSTHPRMRKKLEANPSIQLNPLVEFMKPFNFTDYIRLQKSAYCLVSDSGTVTEEASLLAIPAVMIRDAHERPEGMEQGVAILSGVEPKSVLQAVESAVQMKNFTNVPDYEVDCVSEKVVKIILSYTDYINRTTWYKNKGHGTGL